MDKNMAEAQETSDKEMLAYSYHTFLYPFLYECQSGAEFPEGNLSGRWKLDIGLDNLDFLAPKETAQSENIYSKEEIQMYNTYQYFFPKVNKYIFNSKDWNQSGIHYHYDYGQTGTYSIEYTAENNGEKQQHTITLKINGIRLSLYPKFHIGVLSLEMEYYPEKDCEENRRNAFRINDFGRRMFSPSIQYQIKGQSVNKKQLTSSYMTADSVSFSFDELNKTVEIKYPEYENESKEFRFHQESKMSLLKALLGDETQSVFKWDGFQSVLDDRMFVACLLRDGKFSRYPIDQLMRLSGNERSDGSMKRKLRRAGDEVYCFIFNDGTYSTCQSDRMLRQKLHDHIYDRWIDEGTFNGVTEYSLVCATEESDKVINSVIAPFLTQYIQMVKIALIQRAEIVKLENEISEIASEIPDKEETSAKYIEKAMGKWTEYVRFQTELFMPEVTFQEQGVEIYAMLKKALKIGELKEHLDSELSNFRVLAQISAEKEEKKSSEKVERALNLLTVVGFIFALCALSQDTFSWLSDIIGGDGAYSSWPIYLIYIAAYCGLGWISFQLFKKFNEEPFDDSKWMKAVRYFWIGLMFFIGIIALGTNVISKTAYKGGSENTETVSSVSKELQEKSKDIDNKDAVDSNKNSIAESVVGNSTIGVSNSSSEKSVNTISSAERSTTE